MRYLHNILPALLFIACQNQIDHTVKINPAWKSDYNGVWTSQIGKKAKVDLLTTAGIVPKSEALEKMGPADFPVNARDIYAEVRGGKTYLQFPLETGEQIYGLGLNFKRVHQRGEIFRLHADHYGGIL